MTDKKLTFLQAQEISFLTRTGALGKEFQLRIVEEDFECGKVSESIFHQVRLLYQVCQQRYMSYAEPLPAPSVDVLLEKMSVNEQKELKDNCLFQYAVETLKNAEKEENALPKNTPDKVKDCNFLRNIDNHEEGLKKIIEICQQLPSEWTVLQLCKGPRSENTRSTFPQLHGSAAPIYFTLLKHARSHDYPQPIALRFNSNQSQENLFTKFACIAKRFKVTVDVDPKIVNTKELKKVYWNSLDEINQYIKATIDDLNEFCFPWKFLFTGIPRNDYYQTTQKHSAIMRDYQKKAFNDVDTFCNQYKWEIKERVLLSLTALYISTISDLEAHAICKELTANTHLRELAGKLLLKLKKIAPTGPADDDVDSAAMPSTSTSSSSRKHKKPWMYAYKTYPCLLIIDERLDHFWWEELNVQQEFSRVNSLQYLWRLYEFYKPHIKNGYLNVDIKEGGCLINPGNNLPKMEMRMKSFFEYWTPHWLMKYSEKPTQEELFNDYFKRSCYVYAGHGSGLQYINGKHIAKQRINGVVFLFGCDSSRLHSNGLYSELLGPHLYYHAAMCPTLVGTLMPGLDSNMDNIATAMLSRWLKPKSKNILPWNEIDFTSWSKEGHIKPNKNICTPLPTIAHTPNYHIGSLCAILACVHQRKIDASHYNTVPYVCRGLPAWNIDVQDLPK